MTILNTDLLSLNTQDFGSWSTDPLRPDYARPEYRAMAPRWQIVHDMRGGTQNVREKAMYYLPRFEAEQQDDWMSRVRMSFVNDWYETTLAEHVGLGLGDPVQLSPDVPDVIKALMEDVDGEGNHLDVFSQTVLDQAMHFGHGVLFTDYPVTSAVKDLQDQRRAKIRPYATWYPAPNILNWKVTAIGGTKIITYIVFRENAMDTDGKPVEHFRVISQDVTYDEITGNATGLGVISWRLWRKDAQSIDTGAQTVSDGTGHSFSPIGEGIIKGPTTIPARAVYGGQKLAVLYSRPHLIGLAYSNLEETQVGSDYASCMHKCNVPTPCFVGRQPTAPTQGASGQVVQMGQGLDLQLGGNAFFLEPRGVALAATRQRLEDIRTQMRRQGATSTDASLAGRSMTATEATIWTKQRNAKLKRAVRSLQDGEEAMLADCAAYLHLPVVDDGKLSDGGSVVLNTNFTGVQIDPQYLTVLLGAYNANAFPLEALLYALQNGKLPDDFSAEDEALKLMAAHIADQALFAATQPAPVKVPPGETGNPDNLDGQPGQPPINNGGKPPVPTA